MLLELSKKKEKKTLRALYFLWKLCDDHLATAWCSYQAFCWTQSMPANHPRVPEDAISCSFYPVKPRHRRLGMTEVTFLSWVKWKLATCLFIKIDNPTHTITRGWLAEVAAETEYRLFPDLSLRCIDRSNGLTDQYHSVWRGKRDTAFLLLRIIRELRWTFKKWNPKNRQMAPGPEGGLKLWKII